MNLAWSLLENNAEFSFGSVIYNQLSENILEESEPHCLYLDFAEGEVFILASFQIKDQSSSGTPGYSLMS